MTKKRKDAITCPECNIGSLHQIDHYTVSYTAYRVRQCTCCYSRYLTTEILHPQPLEIEPNDNTTGKKNKKNS